MRSILILSLLSFLLTACGGGGGGDTGTSGASPNTGSGSTITGTGSTDTGAGSTDTGIAAKTCDATASTDDVAPNTDAVSTSSPLIVLDNGIADASWDKGIGAYDEANAPDWGTCENDGGADCPSIGWSVVNDNARGNVLEITHAVTTKEAGLFIQTSSPKDLSAFAGGTIDFDIKVTEGDNQINMKIGCVYPCESSVKELGAIGSDWQSVSVEVNDLVDTGLNLSTVNTGIVIWAKEHNATKFRLDNIQWTANPDGTTSSGSASSGNNWVNPNLTGYSTPTSYDGYTLFWSDEFDEPNIDTCKWGFDIGTGDNGWGNAELQYYREENASLQEGYLVIAAKKENYSTKSYTSARLKSQDKFEFTYGRIDIRAATAAGQGLWSALWMLGANFDQVGWPRSGEIDILDTITADTAVAKTFWNANGLDGGDHTNYVKVDDGAEYKLPDGESLNDQFHVFSLVWTPSSIIWYVDDVKSHELDISSGVKAETFQKDFFLLLNVAVGGNWPGAPPATTTFPQYMLVDYVRVFQQNQITILEINSQSWPFI